MLDVRTEIEQAAAAGMAPGAGAGRRLRRVGVAGLGGEVSRVFVPDAGGGGGADGRVDGHRDRVGRRGRQHVPFRRVASGGAREARIAKSTKRRATWEFAPPAGDKLVGATLWRAGDADGGATSEASDLVWLAGPDRNLAFKTCDSSAGCSLGGNTARLSARKRSRCRAPLDLGGNLYATATCQGLDQRPAPKPAPTPTAMRRPSTSTAPLLNRKRAHRQQRRRRTGDRLHRWGLIPPHLRRERPAVRHLRGRVLGRWPGRTDHGPERKRGRCRNVGETSDGLPAFLYVKPCPSR